MLELPLSLLRSLAGPLSIQSGSLALQPDQKLIFDGTAGATNYIRFSSGNGRLEIGQSVVNFGFGVAGQANQIQIDSSGGGGPPSLNSVGSDLNIGLALFSKGTGTVQANAPIDWKTPGQYTDNSGTPGNTTISKVTGRAAIASGASACVVTNTLVSATSIVFAFCETIGVGVADLVCVPGAGSFTVTSVSATGVATVTTGNLKFSFIIFNV